MCLDADDGRADARVKESPSQRLELAGPRPYSCNARRCTLPQLVFRRKAKWGRPCSSMRPCSRQTTRQKARAASTSEPSACGRVSSIRCSCQRDSGDVRRAGTCPAVARRFARHQDCTDCCTEDQSSHPPHFRLPQFSRLAREGTQELSGRCPSTSPVATFILRRRPSSGSIGQHVAGSDGNQEGSSMAHPIVKTGPAQINRELHLCCNARCKTSRAERGMQKDPREAVSNLPTGLQRIHRTDGAQFLRQGVRNRGELGARIGADGLNGSQSDRRRRSGRA
jgi:hypothetical protein